MNETKNKKKIRPFKIKLYDLPTYLFFIGIILLICYFAVYFNPFSNPENYTNFGPKNIQNNIRVAGFILSFVSILFILFRNLIIKNSINFLTSYSLFLILLIAAIIILFLIDDELTKEPRYVDALQDILNINFFNNWANSIRGSLIFSLLFLYIVVSTKIISNIYITLSVIFITLSILPAALLLNNSPDINLAKEAYELFAVEGNYGWDVNRILTYYASFSSLFIAILYIYSNLLSKNR